MQLKRYADFGAARHLPADALAKLRRSSAVRCLIVCPAFLLASCRQEGVLDPQGPIASAQRLLLLINATEIILLVNQLAVTVGARVRFRLTSATVMNSFFRDARIRDSTSAKNRKANRRGGAAAGEIYAGEVRDALA